MKNLLDFYNYDINFIIYSLDLLFYLQKDFKFYIKINILIFKFNKFEELINQNKFFLKFFLKLNK